MNSKTYSSEKYPDINYCDSFLWGGGGLKSSVFRTKLDIFAELKARTNDRLELRAIRCADCDQT